ncbi:type II secretion system protein N [Psychromarinibacter sp. S121]|uniref:type II secretion system protein N n=1 Tax=Psychromarinibacter sp. S121 TaxID=3415127 RepID=UPI003C7D451F
MRVLVLILVFLGGALVALAWQGRMQHLRSVTDLPGWTDAVTPDSTVRKGSAILPDGLPFAGMTVSWTAQLPNASGWQWNVRLRGDGVDSVGRVSVPFWPTSMRVRISDGSGPVSALVPGVTGDITGAQGVLYVTGLNEAPVVTGDVTAEVVGANVAGTGFGSGPLHATLDREGNWTADLALSDGAAPVEADARGTLTETLFTYSLRVAESEDLPPEIVSALDRIGRPDGAGWIIEGSAATR